MKKILVIDDAEFILESTSTLLMFEGYDVVTASDGLEGVDSAFEHRPDLILCDISMPNLDGYGVIQKLRANDLTKSTPFIFLTAFTEKQNMRKGMELGADDFLVKPYTRDELLAAIDTQWKKHKVFEEKIQKKVEEVGKNLNYALPHEFRTVINQVKGSAKILSNDHESFDKEDVQEITNDIIESCDRLLKITENFLIYVKIESYSNNPEIKRNLKKSKTDEPGALVYDMMSSTAMRHERMNDMVIGDIPDGLYVNINSESYHKIIDELIDNAFKFSKPESKVKLDMELKDGYLWTVIKDNGRGMKKDQLKNIGAYIQFERTIYEQQGVGLGLVIAKRLVEVHDGEFQIDSEEGVGTTIKFSLPYKKSS